MQRITVTPARVNRLITMADAAASKRVSVRTIQRWIKTGKLPAYKVGGYAVRIDVLDLEAMTQPIPVAADDHA